MRHLDTLLWIQQAVRSRRIDLRKVLGETNPADIVTKHSSSSVKLENLVSVYGCKYSDGRASSALMLRRSESTKVRMVQASENIDKVADSWASGQTPPIISHLHLSKEKLDVRHPILVPDEKPLHDLQQDDAFTCTAIISLLHYTVN